eukprot:TRINITY_DN3776_c0_g1_i1.p1 TRINITY_DN3776_c0_g1~~TRINITY_DN3776_c0_g1_i1.p1  ORF type:complete len:260 (-),score=43.15 TRINITY_DN3776_c0_g1_i1:43-822(-)
MVNPPSQQLESNDDLLRPPKTDTKMGWGEYFRDLMIILKTHNVVVSTFMYSLVIFNFVLVDEITAVWLSLPIESGGMAFTSSDIGSYYAMNGVCLVIGQLLILPKLSDYLSLVNMFKFGAAFYSIVVTIAFYQNMFLPLRPNLAFLFWGGLFVYIFIKAVLGGAMYVSSNLMINESAPSGLLGSTNGFSYSVGAIFRTSAPLIGGAILTWSLEHDYSFPLDYHLPTVCAGLSVFISLGLSFTYRAPSNQHIEIPDVPIV